MGSSGRAAVRAFCTAGWLSFSATNSLVTAATASWYLSSAGPSLALKSSFLAAMAAWCLAFSAVHSLRRSDLTSLATIGDLGIRAPLRRSISDFCFGDSQGMMEETKDEGRTNLRPSSFVLRHVFSPLSLR